MGVDFAKMSAAEIRAEAERRRALRARGESFDVRGPAVIGLDQGEPARVVTQTAALAVATAEHALRPGHRVAIGEPPVIVREGDRLTMTLPFPPRTKKNSKVNIATQSKAARRYEHQVRAFIEPHAAALALPLPEQGYNCAALFVTDNAAADTVGLMQALADALERAGVVTNDRLIRRWDGTDQMMDQIRPRVELTLSPIAATLPGRARP